MANSLLQMCIKSVAVLFGQLFKKLGFRRSDSSGMNHISIDKLNDSEKGLLPGLDQAIMWFILVLGIVALYVFMQRVFAKSRLKLQGKLVVVTGGAGGIGRDIAIRFGKEKACVCIWDLESQTVGMAETKVLVEKAGGECRVFPVDVTNPAMVRELMALTDASKSSGIEVFVNNAGVAYKKAFLDTTDAELERTMNVNVLALMYTCQGRRIKSSGSYFIVHQVDAIAVLPLMMKRKRGHIVIVSSLMDSMCVSFT
jgi:hypothetical protein